MLLLSVSGSIDAQNLEFDVIRISKISYLRKPNGEVKEQILIKLNNNKVYKRKKVNAKYKLIDTKKDQLNAVVDVYRSLGGGWQ